VLCSVYRIDSIHGGPPLATCADCQARWFMSVTPSSYRGFDGDKSGPVSFWILASATFDRQLANCIAVEGGDRPLADLQRC